MRKHYIVDAYNLMFKSPDIRPRIETDLEGARDMLLNQLASFAMAGGRKVTVVFDGKGMGSTTSGRAGVRIVYSRSGENADMCIKRLVDVTQRPNPNVVVTSDREIQVFVKHCGAAFVSSDEFLSELNRRQQNKTDITDKFDRDLRPDEVEEWMTIFSKGNQ